MDKKELITNQNNKNNNLNILILNGSPRKEKSCTIRVTRKFIEDRKSVV